MIPAASPTRILGVDPGLRITGFGIVDRNGARLTYVASGVIRVPEGELPARLAVIYGRLREIVDRYAPQQTAVERVFVNVNPASTLLLGQARGAAITALAAAGLPVAEYSALQIKQSVVGYGKASKEQVQQMTVRLLSLPGVPTKDAADALACAVCHAHGAPTLAALGGLAPALARRGLRVRRGRLVQS
jgi:crossover junction endodeoxyribonuclease RuvC